MRQCIDNITRPNLSWKTVVMYFADTIDDRQSFDHARACLRISAADAGEVIADFRIELLDRDSSNDVRCWAVSYLPGAGVPASALFA